MAKCTGMRCPMQYGHKVDECNHTDCPHRTEPMTNADRIRAMSDEELAKACLLPCPYPGDECKLDFPSPERTCPECILDWLKRPAEVGKDGK